MACRDGDSFLSKSNILYCNTQGNRGENAMRFFQKYFNKNWHCSASCGQICSKTVPGGLWYVPVRMVCSRGPGKFCSPRMTAFKVLEMCSILEKVALARWFLYFLHFVDWDGPWVLRMEKRSSGMYIRCHRVSESAQEWLRTNLKKLDIFHEIFTFLDSFQAPSRQFLGCK